MERLTIRTPKGAALKMDDTYQSEDEAKKALMQKYRFAIDRLAAYEDTGLELEELEYIARAKRGELMVTDEELRQAGVSQSEIDRLFEIAVAESEGRLVVLPCKLHELVWYIEDGEVFDDRPFDVSFGRPSGRSENAILFECENGFSFYAGDFGKSVFATEKEAEAAMRKEQKNE